MSVKGSLNKIVTTRGGAYLSDVETRELKQGVRGGSVEVGNKKYKLAYKKVNGKTKAYLK